MTANITLDARAAGGRRFEGKVCVIAGAGQGIGSATARRLAQEGGTLVLGDWVEDSARKVCDEVGAFETKAVPHVGDYSQWDDCQGLIDCAKDAFGRIDVLVVVVGGTIWWQSFQFYTPDQMVAEVNKSLWPTLWCVRAVLPHMIDQKSGSIVTLATYAMSGQFRVPYAAAKGGVMGMTSAVSKEVARHGIRINCISPTGVDAGDRVTPRDHRVDVSPPDLPAEELELIARYRDTDRAAQPMGRRSTAEEQAAAIAFLASEDASFITGQVLPVGGGETHPF